MMRLPDLYMVGTVVEALRQTEIANFIHQRDRRQRRRAIRFQISLRHDEHPISRMDYKAAQFPHRRVSAACSRQYSCARSENGSNPFSNYGDFSPAILRIESTSSNGIGKTIVFVLSFEISLSVWR